MTKRQDTGHAKGAVLLALSLLLCTTAISKESKIVVGESKEINYVTHLFTLAGVCFEDKDYVAEYGWSVKPAAIDSLRKYSKYIEFGRSVNGILAGPLFFGVAACDIRNAEHMDSIVGIIRSMHNDAPDSVRHALDVIGRIYTDNYDSYVKDVYPRVRQQLSSRIGIISERLGENKIIDNWERVLDKEWKHGDYRFLLFRAGEKGPSFNDLNENTNTLYYNLDLDYTIAMFSHEFGIFMMKDELMPIFMEFRQKLAEKSPDLLYLPWNAFESLACWYGCKICNGESDDVKYFEDYEVRIFMEIYDGIYKSGVKDFKDIYRMGMEKYLER
ncbi:MAG: hypothetical protein ACI4A7_06560 [Prevotella sp.]